MKLKNIYLLISLSVIMSACSKSDDDTSNNNPPAGALPSAEFALSNLPEEQYAADAVRIVAESDDMDIPFQSIELLPDGTYLLIRYNMYNYYSAPVQVATKADGNFVIHKNHKTEIRLTRSETDENTAYFNGGEYGHFEKIGEKKYMLSSGIELDLSELNSLHRISYASNGRISHVYVKESESNTTDATKSLCRTWDYNSLELWAYWNNYYVAHCKQTVESNGKVNNYFKILGGDLFEEDEFLDDESEMCYKIIFSKKGTYICFYLDGNIGIAQWNWREESQGTLYYVWNQNYYAADGYVSVRFAGNQMRIYEDYTDREDGNESMRFVVVNTLTSAH